MKEYLQEKHPLYQAHIAIVGATNTGKTTLSRLLQGLSIDTADMMNLGDLSNGILFNNVKWENVEPKVNIHIRDFSGVTDFFPSHANFMLNYGFYILVADTTSEYSASQVERWLYFIQCKAPNATVLVLGTHIDVKECTDGMKSKAEELFDLFKERFSNIISIQFINLLDTEQTKKLLKYIPSVIATPTFGQLIPNSWIEFEEIIKTMFILREVQRISWNEIKEIVTICDIEEDIILAVLQHLKDKGSISTMYPITENFTDYIYSPEFLNELTIAASVSHGRRETTFDFLVDALKWHPKECFELVLEVAEAFDLAFVDREKEKLLIPTGFSYPTSNLEYQFIKAFPAVCSEGKQEYSRVYDLEYIPLAFSNTLFVRLLYYGTPVVCHRSGMVLQNNEQNYLLCIKIDLHTDSFEVKYRGSSEEQANSIFAVCDRVIATWDVHVK